MNFGQALQSLKNGAKVFREGWNGKGMFIWEKPGTIIQEEWCQDPILRQIAHENGGFVEGLPTICMKTADGKVVTGWLASQTDIFAEDWQYKLDDVLENSPEVFTPEELNFDDDDDKFYKALESKNFKEKFVKQDAIEDAKKEIYEFREEGGYQKYVNERDSIADINAKIQQDVLAILNKGGDKLSAVKELQEKYMASAKTEEETQAIEEAFTMFLDYLENC